MEDTIESSDAPVPDTVNVAISRELLARAYYLYAPPTPKSLVERGLRILIQKEERRWKRWAKSLGGEWIDPEWEQRQSDTRRDPA